MTVASILPCWEVVLKQTRVNCLVYPKPDTFCGLTRHVSARYCVAVSGSNAAEHRTDFTGLVRTGNDLHRLKKEYGESAGQSDEFLIRRLLNLKNNFPCMNSL
jgi:hypothetical protein